MKTNFFLLMTAILFFMGMGCEKDTKSNIPTELLKTWKLEGFVDVKTETLKPAEPVGEKCYVLTFRENYTLAGYTSTNEVYGTYSIDADKKLLKIINFGGTEINELFDGPRYVDAIFKIESFSLSEDRLKLFYDGDYYLQFKSQ